MTRNSLLNYLIATVWMVNGLFCKVLNLVPRHQEIVARITGIGHARILTVFIGCLETAMAVWILTGIWKRQNAITQIFVIGTMNVLEFILAPDLLLWGRANALFALLFMILIYYNEFHINNRSTQPA